MDIDQLRTALALIEHRTVNRTAAALGLAPSSVSDRVRRLESDLGAPLFVRDRAGMHPTVAGRSYLAAAANAVHLLDGAAEQLLAAPGLRVGAQASIADELLPDALETLRRAHPGLRVEVRPESDRDRLFTGLDHGDLDAIVLLDTGDDVGDLGFGHPASELEHLDIRDVEMTVVAPPSHPLVGRPVAMADVGRTGGLIGREPRCSFWMATQRWLGPSVEITAVGGLAQVREWVAAGRGIALLPAFAVHADLASGRLVALDAEPPALRLRLVWHPGRDESRLRPLLYALTRA